MVRVVIAGATVAAAAGLAGAAIVASAATDPARWHQVARRVGFPVYRPSQTLGLPLTSLTVSPCRTGFVAATYGSPGLRRHVDVYEDSIDACANAGEHLAVTSATIDGVMVPVSVYCGVPQRCTVADGFKNGFLIELTKAGPKQTLITLDSDRVSLSEFLTVARSLALVTARSATTAPAPPVFGRSADLAPVRGAVRIEPPGQTRFVPLTSASSVPLGTLVDTTRGTVALTSAADTQGHTQTGRFRGGVFRLAQKRAPSGVRGGAVVGLTVVTLAGPRPSGCSTRPPSGSTSAVVARHHPTSRYVWGNAHGNYQSNGSNASATVRGTEWLTEDTCAGTLVRVARGVVSVTDFHTHQTLLVRAGHSYLARGGRARSSSAGRWTALDAKVMCGLGAAGPGVPPTVLCSARPIPAPPHTSPLEGDPGFVFLTATSGPRVAGLSQCSWAIGCGARPVLPQPLPSGVTWTRAGLGVTCTIGASVVRCENRSGHGFTITRNSYSAF